MRQHILLRTSSSSLSTSHYYKNLTKQSSFRLVTNQLRNNCCIMTPSIYIKNNATLQQQQRNDRYCGNTVTSNGTKGWNRWKSTNAVGVSESSNNTTTATNSSITIKPWGKHMVESNGDYRDEMWIEEHVGGPLYQYQKSLPILPIGTIETTLQKLVPTVLPLAKDSTEIQSLQQCIHKFPLQAQHLQDRLQQHYTNVGTSSSWLQQWWNTWCYLQVRDSVVINVSYFFHFEDDPTVSNNNMIQRAATMITAVTQFRNLIVTGQFPAEQIGKGSNQKPLCSVPYKYMFHACRIPQPNQDSYRIYDPSIYDHIIVIIRGQYYKVPIIDPNNQYQPYPIHIIEQALQQCVDMTEQITSSHSGNQLLQLGWCTSSNRDQWANTREQLLQVGGVDMEQALHDIESGMVAICLDIDDTPVSRTEIAQMLLHGTKSNDAAATTSSNSATGANRWFDKSIQLIVSKNGKAGLTGEHSMMDGMPVVQLANYITKVSYADCVKNDQSASTTNYATTPISIQPIFSAGLYEKIRSVAEPCIEKAKSDFNELVGNNSLHVQSFQGYGSTFMKQAGYSPDAFVQMAMQIATYRLWGEQGGTYEATQVRPFLHGRTETTRSVSIESGKLVKKFGLYPANNETDPSIRKEKIQLFQSAVKVHVKYISDASQANGVDRHLLGLMMTAKDGEALPDLYSDPVFQRAKRWRVSTSHLTHPKLYGWGYGQVVPDGVGLAYSIHPRHCVFNITALKHTGWTDKLSQLLEEALLELRTLIEIDQIESSKEIKSKL